MVLFKDLYIQIGPIHILKIGYGGTNFDLIKPFSNLVKMKRCISIIVQNYEVIVTS